METIPVTTKAEVADALINKMHLNKEQYEEFVALADDLELEPGPFVEEKEKSWEELFGE